MKKMYLNQRLTHFFEWLRVSLLIIHNRGRNTYGANGLKRIVQRYLLDYSSSSEQLKSAEMALRKIENLLQLTKIEGLKRLGARNDGGYIGIEPQGKLVVLSGGGGKNIDFEIDLAKKGSRIHVYDPTINKLPRDHTNMTHLKYALAGPENKTFKNL